jgi:hypothetical protein
MGWVGGGATDFLEYQGRRARRAKEIARKCRETQRFNAVFARG